MQPKPSYSLSITTTTWPKQTHHLFLYHSQPHSPANHTKSYELSLNVQTLYLYRNVLKNHSYVSLNPVQLTSKAEMELLAVVSVRKNKEMKKMVMGWEAARERPGVVVGTEVNGRGEKKGVKLVVGQVVKVGRSRLLVQEIKKGERVVGLPQGEYSEGEGSEGDGQVGSKGVIVTDSQPTTQQQNESNSENQQPKYQCRICFQTDTPSDRLINPCNCSGSCKYLHVNCLKRWLQFKAKVIHKQHCIFIEKVNCEVCKKQIPLQVRLPGCEQSQDLLVVDRPKNDYIMLKSLNKKQKNIYILRDVPIEGVSFGRDSSCYIKIDDISVSRVHAYVKYQQGDFYVYDNQSKFGTTVVERQLNMEVGKLPRAVQIGRTLIEMVIKKEQEKILAEL